MSERLTPERLAEIRRYFEQGYNQETLQHDGGLLLAHINTLEAELSYCQQIRDGYSDAVDELHERLRLMTLRAEAAEQAETKLRKGYQMWQEAEAKCNSELNTAEAEAVHQADLKVSLLEALEEIRHHLPYPSDYKGQKVVGGEWSVPPSTLKALQRIVGTRVAPSQLLTEARL